MGSQQQFVGTPVQIKTTIGEDIQGELFCYDVLNGCNAVILREDLKNGFCNYVFAKTNIIKDVKALGPAPSREPEALPAIDIQLLTHREEQALRNQQRNRMQIGVGVTRQAQEIFDRLRQTMQCDWQDTSILVMKTVLISKPYRPEDCTQVKELDNPQQLDRVKKVLAGEREKLARKEKEKEKKNSSGSGMSSPAPS
jgi:hypothetical protein